MEDAYLVLGNGAVFPGKRIGAAGDGLSVSVKKTGNRPCSYSLARRYLGSGIRHPILSPELTGEALYWSS